MKDNKIKYFLLEILFIIILSLLLITYKNLAYKKTIISIFILVYAFLIKKIINAPQKHSIHKREIFKYMVLFAILYILLYYVLGIYFGFYKNIYRLSPYTIITFIIPITIIIISFEIIRGQLINVKSNFSLMLIYIMGILVDTAIYMNINSISTLDQFLSFFGSIFISSITSNYLYNFTNKNYGILPNIAYRLIIVLHMYIIPFTPSLYEYFISFCRIIYPAIIYILLKDAYIKSKNVEKIKSNRYFSISSFITLTIMLIIMALISCKFRYGLLVVGSDSMSSAIDKGDIIVFNSKAKIENINIDDVILFEKNDRRILHRVVEIEEQDGERRLYTKGDNNPQKDSLYVTEENFRGKINLKIAKFGYPTLWLNDLFKELKGK